MRDASNDEEKKMNEINSICSTRRINNSFHHYKVFRLPFVGSPSINFVMHVFTHPYVRQNLCVLYTGGL